MQGPNPSNIQEKLKKYEKQISLLRSWLRSDTFAGTVLRVLVNRLKYPAHPYSSLDLQVLLLLTIAEMDQ